ncbi:hypothetical protein ABT158_08865 [Nonomuraea sp. NPDC001636]|uniref:hypothetical protein n=1 Tax=Nonomuraea sp. NPDC001636 TaxID=3154391 RepID=UPI003330E40E
MGRRPGVAGADEAGSVGVAFGASAWNLVLGIGGPVVLPAAFGGVGVSIVRTPMPRERVA